MKRIRIKQTKQCRAQRHGNAGSITGTNPTAMGDPRFLRDYRRAGIVIPETWTEIEVNEAQLATLRADVHVELEELTAASAADTETT